MLKRRLSLVPVADMEVFRRASIQFANCMRHHGVTNFPLPNFASANPYAGLTKLDIDWNSAGFASIVNLCRRPLEDVFMS